MSRYLSMRYIAEDIGVSVKSVTRIIARKELPVAVFGRNVRVPEDAYLAYKARLTHPAKADEPQRPVMQYRRIPRAPKAGV
ncbi:helix-turn-helix domain-containing protein [Mycobacterium sp. KBS0706]|uniref:helix-turn-helix domain-containing protein n=1 Tax=Mycobacterium sp. KBS0706 TaxID=2578109 RepID=UPI00110F7DD2|nr:helix-turn-helix domain-containing protein [Mycobacterium sp. KBS0706]TSD88030.1 helix-turn-helix domain-containing protein [Mycobacterium sp. KBS0706]